MTLAKFKWEVLDCIGYVFCEFSFRWSNYTGDAPWDEVRRHGWVSSALDFIGSASYGIGCFFYNLQDDEVAGGDQ